MNRLKSIFITTYMLVLFIMAFHIAIMAVSNGFNPARFGALLAVGLPASMEMFGYHSDTVRPTAIITDKECKIIYADLTEDYRIRPEPDIFLRALEEHI